MYLLVDKFKLKKPSTMFSFILGHYDVRNDDLHTIIICGEDGGIYALSKNSFHQCPILRLKKPASNPFFIQNFL